MEVLYIGSDEILTKDRRNGRPRQTGAVVHRDSLTTSGATFVTSR